MMPSLAQVIVGSLAGIIVKWKRRGFGILQNLGMSLIGALIGGLLFRRFGVFPKLDAIAISLRDDVAVCTGSLRVLVALEIGERSRGPRGGCPRRCTARLQDRRIRRGPPSVEDRNGDRHARERRARLDTRA